MLQPNRLSINAIGKIKKKWIRDGIHQYKKRMPDLVINESKFFNINNLKINNNIILFTITDFKNEVNVSYSGLVPNLFQEKKGVVAEGFLTDKNFLEASKILAKHDENYMPIEIKKD